jgi:cell shape-determining protein MreC
MLSGSDWRKIRSLINETTANKTSKEVKKLNRSLHHMSVKMAILKHENKGLKDALRIKKKQKKKSYSLHLQNNEVVDHGGAVL